MVVESWATLEDVENYTNAQVTEAQLTQAQALTELFAGTTVDTPTGNISSRNLRMLRMAVSYQAAWITERPDLYTHIDLDSYSQDGASGQYSHANANLLAPLAKRCLDRLSWRNAPLRVRSAAGGGYYDDLGPRDSAVHDDSRPWTPV